MREFWGEIGAILDVYGVEFEGEIEGNGRDGARPSTVADTLDSRVAGRYEGGSGFRREFTL